MAPMTLPNRFRTSDRQLARLIAWAQLMLAWIGAMLFAANPPRPSRRHIRRRYHLFDLEALARMVSRLILIRACALAHRRPAPNRSVRNYARPGFFRRTRPRNLLRAAVGARLRRRLRHRDLRARLAALTRALADIDAAARDLVPRLERRLTRLHAIVLVRPPHTPARSVAPRHAPCPADTS